MLNRITKCIVAKLSERGQHFLFSIVSKCFIHNLFRSGKKLIINQNALVYYIEVGTVLKMSVSNRIIIYFFGLFLDNLSFVSLMFIAICSSCI